MAYFRMLIITNKDPYIYKGNKKEIRFNDMYYFNAKI